MLSEGIDGRVGIVASFDQNLITAFVTLDLGAQGRQLGHGLGNGAFAVATTALLALVTQKHTFHNSIGYRLGYQIGGDALLNRLS